MIHPKYKFFIKLKHKFLLQRSIMSMQDIFLLSFQFGIVGHELFVVQTKAAKLQLQLRPSSPQFDALEDRNNNNIIIQKNKKLQSVFEWIHVSQKMAEVPAQGCVIYTCVGISVLIPGWFFLVKYGPGKQLLSCSVAAND